MSRMESKKPGETYFFSKSGSKVILVATTKAMGKKAWSVRRADTGKAMIVPEDSLVPIRKCGLCGRESMSDMCIECDA